jgi:hypothetical protein
LQKILGLIGMGIRLTRDRSDLDPTADGRRGGSGGGAGLADGSARWRDRGLGRKRRSGACFERARGERGDDGELDGEVERAVQRLNKGARQ